METARGGLREGGAAFSLLRCAAAVLAAAAAAACASRAPVPLRTEPVPLADTLPIEEPAARPALEAGRLFKQVTGGQLTRPLDLRRLLDDRHPALNVTRFDRVVASSWFEPRIGAGGLSPAEVADGDADAPPDSAGPLTVVAGKSAGISPGFTVRDASGRRYLFKFDPRGHLHLASTADVVSARLLRAAGYHVPEEYKVAFDADRLELAPDAEVETSEGVERPMRRSDVRAILERTDTLPDGRHVALASRFVPGVPKGPFHFGGRREDDPNDHYEHQHRRELRGLYVLAAWLNHVDIRFANTLTSYVEPGYLRHYLIDFGATLGSGTIRPHLPREGAEHNFDLWRSVGRLLTLGFYRTGWEGAPRPEPLHPQVGWMPVEGFDPDGWAPNWPNPAFWSMTPADAYWAAKIVAAFGDAHLRAAVRAGKLPDPAAADTLADALIHRRDRTVAHWYAEVTPLEAPAARTSTTEGGPPVLELAFRDLGLEEALWSPAQTTYRWRFRHPAAGIDRRGRTRARRRETQAVEVPLSAAVRGAPTGGTEALATLEVTAVRPRTSGREAVVHLRWTGPERGYEVAGLRH